MESHEATEALLTRAAGVALELDALAAFMRGAGRKPDDALQAAEAQGIEYAASLLHKALWPHDLKATE